MYRFICVLLLAFVSLHSSPLKKIPDEREWLVKSYIPILEGKILYVGVGSYTVNYYKFAKDPSQFETLDFLPERACFGSPYKHYVEDFFNFSPGFQYDHVSLFGVMGHYIDKYYNIIDTASIVRSLETAHRLIKIGGTLQLGPNYVTVPEQNADFWIKQFSSYPLNKYQVLLNGIGPYNMVWWGRKIRD